MVVVVVEVMVSVIVEVTTGPKCAQADVKNSSRTAPNKNCIKCWCVANVYNQMSTEIEIHIIESIVSVTSMSKEESYFP